MAQNTENMPSTPSNSVLPERVPIIRNRLNIIFSLFQLSKPEKDYFQPYLAQLLDSTQDTSGELKGWTLILHCLVWTVGLYSFGWLWFITGIVQNPDRWSNYIIGVAFDLSLIFVCLNLTYSLYQERDDLIKLMGTLGIKDLFRDEYRKFEHREQITIVFFVVLTIFLEWFAFRATPPSGIVSSFSSGFASVLIGIAGGSWASYLYGTLASVSHSLSGEVNAVLDKCNPVQPGKTVELRQLLNLVARHLGNSAITLAVPLFLGLIFWKFSPLSGFIYSYLIGLIIMWGTLLIPLLQLLNALTCVTNGKKLEMLRKIEAFMKSTPISEQTPEAFQKLTTLYQTIENSPELPVDLSGLGRVLVSFALTLSPAIIKFVFPWIH